jgi:hypothetical protein
MGTQAAYGRKYQGSIVGYTGLCISVAGANTTDGTPTVAFPCLGQWYDQFLKPADTQEHLRTPANNKCLTVQNGTAPNPIISWTCGNFFNERFTFGNTTSTGAELRAMGNQCLEYSGGTVQVNTCNGTDSQRWDVQHANGSIRSDQIHFMGSGGGCLSTRTTNGAIGESLTVAACSTTDTKQRFTYSGQGTGVVSMSNNSGLCLNVSGGTPLNPPHPLILWDGCGNVPPPPNEAFYVHGRLRTLNNCVQINNDLTISAQACDANNLTTQLWDYYL